MWWICVTNVVGGFDGGIVMIFCCFGGLNWCKGKGEPVEQIIEQGTENEHGFKFRVICCFVCVSLVPLCSFDVQIMGRCFYKGWNCIFFQVIEGWLLHEEIVFSWNLFWFFRELGMDGVVAWSLFFELLKFIWVFWLLVMFNWKLKLSFRICHSFI